MRETAVRPGLGPTLPELVRPLPRGLRRALAALAVLAAVAVVAARVGGGAAVERVVVERPVAFNVAVPAALERARPPRGAALALASPPDAPVRQRAVVEPLRLPAYAGDPTAALMDVASQRAGRLRTALDGFVLRQEGRTRINEQPGYQVLFQFRDEGRTAYGRLVLLVAPEEVALRPREGAVLELRSQRSPAVPSVGALGSNGPLKSVLRSLRLGTEAP